MSDVSRQIKFLDCPVCQTNGIVQMPDDWQQQVGDGHSIAIVGCGNPWHYRFPEEDGNRPEAGVIQSVAETGSKATRSAPSRSASGSDMVSLGDRVTTGFHRGEEAIVRTVTMVKAIPKSQTGVGVAADGGEPCVVCDRPLGRVVGLVDSSWFRIVTEESRDDR